MLQLRVDSFKIDINSIMIVKIFISNIFLLIGIINQANIDINYHKSNLNIEVISFNGQDYISINQLPKIFIMNKEVVSDEYSLQYRDEKLIFSEFSFFVVYKSNSQMRVAQMSHTATKINDELCIPIISFFKALNSLNLINSQIVANKSIDIIDFSIFQNEIIKQNLKINIPETKVERKVVQEKDSTLKRKIIKNKGVIDIYEYNEKQEIERGKYLIPRSIKK